MEETSFWDQLKKNVLQGIKVAADRTDEIARIGKLKLDLFNLKRQLTHEYGDLGKELVRLIDSSPKDGEMGQVKEFLDRDAVKKILFHIITFRDQIAAVEKQILEVTAPQEKGKSDPSSQQ
jgi:hypothetical protein